MRENGDKSRSYGPGNPATMDWSDPKLAARRLLATSVPFLVDNVTAVPHVAANELLASDALESTAASIQASPWNDLAFAAKLLTDASPCSVTDTFLAYARAQGQALEAVKHVAEI